MFKGSAGLKMSESEQRRGGSSSLNLNLYYYFFNQYCFFPRFQSSAKTKRAEGLLVILWIPSLNMMSVNTEGWPGKVIDLDQVAVNAF